LPVTAPISQPAHTVTSAPAARRIPVD